MMKVLLLVIFFYFINGVLTTTTTTSTPPSPSTINPELIDTGPGSFFEYAVRNVIRHAPYSTPFVRTQNNRITDLQKMIYYYHLQMRHIDMIWLRNWMMVRQNEFSIPSIFELPSRIVNNNQENINYKEAFTLDSHRLYCEECNREFACNVHLLHSHLTNQNLYRANPKPLFKRRPTTTPYDRILEQHSRIQHGYLDFNLEERSPPFPLPSTSSATASTSSKYVCEAAPIIYITTTTTTNVPPTH